MHGDILLIQKKHIKVAKNIVERIVSFMNLMMLGIFSNEAGTWSKHFTTAYQNGACLNYGTVKL